MPPVLVLPLVVLGVVGLCFAGIGLAMLTGRRRRIGACSCSFDADRERARAGRGQEACRCGKAEACEAGDARGEGAAGGP